MGFIVAYLRRCVAAIGSQQLGIKGLRSAELIDELAEQAQTFLTQFAAQVKTICRLTGRRTANFIDVMNALYFLDGELYQEMLKLGSDNRGATGSRRTALRTAAVGGLEDDTRALNVYMAYRLNRPVQCPVVTWQQVDEGHEFVQLPTSISMPTSYLEQSIKTVIDTSKATERVLRGGASATPLPSINYDSWITHPSVFCRVYPPGKTAANVGRMKRFAAGDDAMQLNLAPPITQIANKYNLHVGVLQRPARLANEQLAFTERSDLLKPAKVPPVSTNTASDADGANEPPPLVPSRPPRSATLIPTHICPWYPRIPPLSTAYPRDDNNSRQTATHLPDLSATRDHTSASEDDRTALHLELCSIQPDHPPIIRSELTRSSKFRRTEIH